jgi:uncharacterized protein YoxC
MIVDICAGVISMTFIVLVIYLVITLRKAIEMLKQTKHSMTHVDQLIKTANDLALDFKEKSEALNILFRPLMRLSKKKIDPKYQKYEKIAEMINFATDGIVLFNELKKK